MKKKVLFLLVVLMAIPLSLQGESADLIFGVYAEDEEQLAHALVLAESIRTFAGSFAKAPVWISIPEGLEIKDNFREKAASLNVEFRRSKASAEALQFPFAGKVFAAAAAEAEAAGKTSILAWMDEDTIVLREPGEFRLKNGINFAYRPVMHLRIGSLYAEPPDDFWRLVYEKLAVPEAAIFPMVTPADRQTIRPYFNAGLLVVRPERGILRKWAESFPLLYQDARIVEACTKDNYKVIFLHQAALAGAVLNLLRREEMEELSLRYNFPLFFQRMFGAVKEFDSLENVVTIRYDVYFRNPDPDWTRQIKGPAEVIAWIKDRLDRR